MKNWNFSGNVLVVLIFRIVLILFLYSLCRVGFYLFNHNMFPGLTPGQFITILKGGLVFDISATVYINMLFILLQAIPFDFRYNKTYQKVLSYLFFITNGIAFAVNCMDFVFYRFVLKRATADVFKIFENESNLVKIFFRFLTDYITVTLFCILIWFLMIYIYNKVKVKKPVPKDRIAYHVINVLLFPLVVMLVIGSARGGFRHSTRPITISNAARYVKSPRDVAIVLNTPLSIFRTLGKEPLVKYEFYSRSELDRLFNPHYKPAVTKSFREDNIVIIILESFAREYIGSLNREIEGGTYEGYTPFIDSLIKESLTFEVSLGNGKRSIDAMPSILASLPSLRTPYIISHYANNQINGLASLLKKKGYYTAFFHGAPNGSMGFDSFARMAGFDNYIGLDQYPERGDFDGMWGIWDEPFFKFFANSLDKFPQPFMASIFSVSSHHPFEVPKKYENKFKKGPAPIIEVVGYTDFALKEFFKEITDAPWFKNTLFVITADHTNESIHEEFQNHFGSYSIPIIFYKPGSDLKGIKQRIAQQIDIMPSILSYLHYDQEFIAFGNDLFDDSYESFAFNTSGSVYLFYMNDHILEMIDNKPMGLFNYKTDRLLENNLIERETELAGKMEQKMKAIIQSYNTRMIDNELTVKDQK